MVHITERAVQRIVVDLERGGYLKRQRVGRRNHYRLKPGLHLRHPLERHVEVGRLLTILRPGKTTPQNRKSLAAVTARRRNALPAHSHEKASAAFEKAPHEVLTSARQRIGVANGRPIKFGK